MQSRSISLTIGKGSLAHNDRSFIADNVDEKRTQDNIEFINEDIKQAYHKLFDEALFRYNAKQTRNDRIIDDYYEKIRTGKQEKLFHEIVVQIGNKDTMNARTNDGKLAETILTDYMNDFIKRNDSLYVFSAHLHMDEETPHLHIDFIPYVSDSKRGLDTRVSLKQALSKLGYASAGRVQTEFMQWQQAEKEKLAEIMKSYDVEWDKLGTHEEHLSVYNYKKQERIKEVEQLDKQIENLSNKLSDYKSDIDEIESINSTIEADIWNVPEPRKFMSATSYKRELIDPFIARLKRTITKIVNNYIDLKREIKSLYSTIWSLKTRIIDQNKTIAYLKEENYRMSVKLKTFHKTLGYKTYDDILNNTKEINKNVRKDKNR